MKTREKLIAGVAVAGMLFGGAGPAFAGGNGGHAHHDGIKVIVVEKHEKSGKKKIVHEKKVGLWDAARFADHKCDHGDKWYFYDKAKWVEENNEEWKKACSYDHGNNKNKKYYVFFTDVDKKHWDGHHGKH